MKLTKEELLKLGFKEKENEKGKYLTLILNKGKDRFYHFLEWYEDQPDKFYINVILIGKIKTISEEDFWKTQMAYHLMLLNIIKRF